MPPVHTHIDTLTMPLCFSLFHSLFLSPPSPLSPSLSLPLSSASLALSLSLSRSLSRCLCMYVDLFMYKHSLNSSIHPGHQNLHFVRPCLPGRGHERQFSKNYRKWVHCCILSHVQGSQGQGRRQIFHWLSGVSRRREVVRLIIQLPESKFR